MHHGGVLTRGMMDLFGQKKKYTFYNNRRRVYVVVAEEKTEKQRKIKKRIGFLVFVVTEKNLRMHSCFNSEMIFIGLMKKGI